MQSRLSRRGFLLFAMAPTLAWPRIPAELGASLVESPSMFGDRVFDLTPALALARFQNKPLFVYLGANDCPPCRQFSDFLKSNVAALAPSFSTVVPVEIRTWLQGGSISFKCYDKSYSVKSWLRKMGASSSSLRYPSFWFLTPDLVPITQLGNDVSEIMSVPKFVEIFAKSRG